MRIRVVDGGYAIILNRLEAEELRKILREDLKPIPKGVTVEDAPFRNKLDLGLDMVGVLKPRRK